jgi:hypothetical protein
VNELGKTKKVMTGITSTALLLGLAGCGVTSTPEAPMSEKEFEAFMKENHSTSPVPSSSTSYSYNGSSSSSTYVEENIDSVPTDQSCVQWEWDLDDGIWECEDSTSPYYGHYYHGGIFYASKPDLYKSTNYINYKNSSTFKGKGTTINTSTGSTTVTGGTTSHGSTGSSTMSGGTTIKGSTGFGSGSSSFGG